MKGNHCALPIITPHCTYLLEFCKNDYSSKETLIMFRSFFCFGVWTNLALFLLAISGLFFVVSTRICWCRRWARWPLDYRQTRSPNFLIIMSFQSDSNPRLLTSLQLPFIIVWQIFCWENVAKLLKCLKTIYYLQNIIRRKAADKQCRLLLL